jgi:hypothetical protein
MAKKRMIQITLLATILLWAVGCDDARDAWKKILSKCASTDKIGSDAIFFGASNTIGPGSVWRKKDDGSYVVMFELSDIFPQQGDRDKILHPNNVATCQGTNSSSWEVKGQLPFEGGSTPVSGDLSVDLKKASKTTVTVNGWSTVDLKETPWKAAVNGLPDDNAFKKDVFADNRYLAETAVFVSGLTASFEFSTDLATTLNVKYPNGKTIKIGGDGLSLQVNWTSDTTLALTSPGDFYIMAAYSQLQNGAPHTFLADNLKWKHVAIAHPKNVKTGNEREAALQKLK